MLTEVGRRLKELQLANNEKSKDMAAKLGVTSTFLSAVCNGKKKCPDSWYKRVPEIYKLSSSEHWHWYRSVIYSNEKIHLNLEHASEDIKTIIIALVNHGELLSNSQIDRIRKTIAFK